MWGSNFVSTLLRYRGGTRGGLVRSPIRSFILYFILIFLERGGHTTRRVMVLFVRRKVCCRYAYRASKSANSQLKVNKSNGYLKSLTSYCLLNYYRTALVYN